jgi:hypothetical protein
MVHLFTADAGIAGALQMAICAEFVVGTWAADRGISYRASALSFVPGRARADATPHLVQSLAKPGADTPLPQDRHGELGSCRPVRLVAGLDGVRLDGETPQS